MGPHCQTGLCFPQCMHGGNCTAPGKCSCPPGYQGEHCEGGEWGVFFFSRDFIYHITMCFTKLNILCHRDQILFEMAMAVLQPTLITSVKAR